MAVHAERFVVRVQREMGEREGRQVRKRGGHPEGEGKREWGKERVTETHL